MNKLFVLLCCILGSTVSSFAQARLDTNTFIFSRILPVSPTHVVTVQQNWSRNGLPIELYFQSISGTSGAKTEKLVSLKMGPLKALVKDVFIWDGKLNLLTSLYHPGPGRSNFILQQYDAKTLKEQHSQIIDAVATPMPSGSSSYQGYCISPDSSHIGFYSWIYAYSEDSVRLNVQVFDQNLQKKWSKQYTLPYLNNRFLINNCALRNNGEFFLFAENYDGRIGATAVIRASRVEHMAIHLRQDLDTVRVLRPQLEKGAFFSSIKFGLAPDETLYGIGIWQIPRFATESGLYTLKMRLGSENFTQNLEELPRDLYQNALREARQDSVFGNQFTATSFFEFGIQKLNFQPQGQIYLFARNFESNMVLRLNAEAKTEYISIIPTLKFGFLNNTYSTNLFLKGDSVFCLQTQVLDPLFPSHKLIRIDAKGEIIHSVVQSRITARKPQFILNTDYCEQVDPTHIVLTATDSTIPFFSPRTLTFRIELIDNVFKDN